MTHPDHDAARAVLDDEHPVVIALRTYRQCAFNDGRNNEPMSSQATLNAFCNALDKIEAFAALADPSPACRPEGAGVLSHALERIAAATPRNTNSATADAMASWCKAVAVTALSDATHPKGAAPELTAEIVGSLRNENAELRDALRKAAEALVPVANGVYNDNGDMTVSTPHLDYDKTIAGYFAENKARHLLERLVPTNHPPGPAQGSDQGERIISAAILHHGRPYSVRAPGRHHDVIRLLDRLFPAGGPFTGEQGFLTSACRFVDRTEAARIAIAADQIIPVPVKGRPTRSDIHQLYSEDVW